MWQRYIRWLFVFDLECACSLLQLAQAEIGKRLGYINIFHPAEPGMYYLLDLTNSKDREVAYKLYKMAWADDENHKNMLNLTVDGRPKNITEDEKLWLAMCGMVEFGKEPRAVVSLTYWQPYSRWVFYTIATIAVRSAEWRYSILHCVSPWNMNMCSDELLRCVKCWSQYQVLQLWFVRIGNTAPPNDYHLCIFCHLHEP